MPEEQPHFRILHELSEQFRPLFEGSPEGIYLYIDEVHKVCNARFASMFGLRVAEWEAMEGFVNVHVAEADQERFVSNYHEHVHRALTPAGFRFVGVRKAGSTFDAETDLIPLPWRGEMLALHLVGQVP
jgi:PAS domain-containing protein